MSLRRWEVIACLACALIVAGLFWWDGHTTGKARTSEITAGIAKGEANTHAQAATAIPNHQGEIQSASQNVDRARAKVARVGRNLEAKPGIPVPDHASSGEAVPQALDFDTGSPLLDALNAERELTKAQDAKIKVLEVALSDEQKRSSEWKATAEARERQAMAQEAATKAWRSAVTTSRWTGRVEGFIAGAALGYLGGRR